MEYTDVATHRYALFRLLDIEEGDPNLEEHGEGTNDVAYLYLTRGCRAAQRFMLKSGYQGWQKRSSALTWTGSDATTGGQQCSNFPADFLRAYGAVDRVSALEEANGDRWGVEVHTEDALRYTGDVYFFRGEELWVGRQATPPATLYLRYHYKHPAWSDSVTIDFPLEARALIVAEAADRMKTESWLSGDVEMERKIREALLVARGDAMDVARPTKAPRRLRRRPRFGNRW